MIPPAEQPAETIPPVALPAAAKERGAASPAVAPNYDALWEEARRLKGVSLGRDAWRRLKRNRVAMVALWGLVALCWLAFFTPVLPLQPPQQVNTELRYARPVFQLKAEQKLTLDETLDDVPAKLSTARVELSEAIEKLYEQHREIERVSEIASADSDRLEKARNDLREARKRLRKAVEGVELSVKDPQLDTEAALREYEDADVAFESSQAWYDHIADSFDWAAGDVGWARVVAEEEQKQIQLHEDRITDILQGPYKEAGFGRLNAWNRGLVKVRLALFGNWSLASVCGRDELGRDLLSRLFWGARISLAVGLVSTLVSLLIGVTYGAVSGYLGGWVDNLMMRLVDILYSIPFIFVVIFLVMILGQDKYKNWLEDHGIDRITVFFFVVGAIYWLTMARVVRGQVISLKQEQFIEAARTLGASDARIIFRHLIPNLGSVVIVYLTLTIPSVMLFEAFLSFLGLGVEPPNVSWGLLAHDGMKVINPVVIHWWLVLFPGMALGGTLLALNFLGDGLRDALDPRLRDHR